MDLNPQQFEQLQEALLSAFRKRYEFERLARFYLGEHLSEIAGDGSLDELTFDLIDWADSRGKLENLVVGAFHRNPTNPKLRAYVRQYYPVALTAEEALVLPGAETTTGPAPSRKYQALTDFLRAQDPALTTIVVTFSAIEDHIHGKLPPFATKVGSKWWANAKGRSVQSRAWLQAGWRVKQVDIPRHIVTFERIEVPPHSGLHGVDRDGTVAGDAVVGNGEAGEFARPR